MAYTQSPGRMNMPKTGRGVDIPTLMTGSPARQNDPIDGTTFTVSDDTGARLSSSNSTTTPGGTRKKTNFSTNPSEKAKQKEWIKNNPEKYKKALEARNKKPVTTVSSSSESDSTSKNQIKKESKSLLQQEVGKINMSRFKSEMLAVKDSANVATKTYKDLLIANPTADATTQSYIQRHAANEGNKTANVTRTNANIPTVDRIAGTHDNYNGSINKGNSSVETNKHWTKNGKADKTKTVLLPNERSTFKRKSNLYFGIPK